MKLAAVSLLVLLVGCSTGNKKRSIASYGKHECSLEKHPTKPYFKVLHKNEPLYKHWYDQDYANSLLHRSIKKGKCN